MPVVKRAKLKLDKVDMEGATNTDMAVVIGEKEGWSTNTLRVFRLNPGGFTPHHQHDWYHVNYIIRGRGTLTLGEDIHEVAEGDFAFVPPNTMHQFKNAGDGEFAFICIVPNLSEYKS